MKIKRIIALLLSICMLFLCGCGKNGPSGANDGNLTGLKTESANLLYCANDTFNPYTLTTKVNMELCQLLFEPLVTLSNNFEPIYRLAESAVQDGKVWSVKLKHAKFSDESLVSADDVIYSFNLAKKCDVYSSSLSHVSSAVKDGEKVNFNLSYNDPFFINLLTFPIIKAESDKITDADSVLFPPIGAGPYVLNDEKTKLGLNPNYYSSPARFGTINLVNAPDKDSVGHYVEVGATDFYYADILDGTIFRMDGKKLTVNQNRLVYIGMNMRMSVFKEPKVRYCLSAAIDREKISKNAYYSNALPAESPLNPAFLSEDNYKTLETKANTKIAIENLEQIGYNILDNSGFRKNNAGRTLEFTLLINADNVYQQEASKIIVSDLREVGIRVTVRALDYENYLSALNSGSFQLYLAEVKVNNNFDLSELIVPGGKCAFGIAGKAQTQESETPENAETQSTENAMQSTVINNDLTDLVKRYENGTVTISQLVSAVSSQMPFIPVCYRTGILFYNSKIEGINNASSSDLFMSFKNNS